jgi:hypothetical protein
MNDERDQDSTGDDGIGAVREGVIAADDTGMLSNEILIVETEMEEGERP